MSICIVSFAQVRERPYDSVNGGYGPAQTQNTLGTDTLERPALKYISFSLNEPRVVLANLDSLIDDVHLVEPIFHSDFLVPNLGSDLSAGQWQPWYASEEGIDMGHHLYDGLFHATESSSLVQVNRSFSEIHLAPGFYPLNAAVLGSSHFTAKFYKSFARRLFFNFNYKSMSDDGSNTRQSNSLKRLDIKMFQRSKSGNRLTYLIYDRPIIIEDVGGEISSGESISLDNGHRSITIGNNLQFRDSLSSPLKFTLDTRLSYKISSYNASSTSLDPAGSPLVGFVLPTNSLSYSNAVSDVTLSNKLVKNLESGALSLSLDLSRLNQTLGDSIKENYFQGILGIGYATELKENISLNTEAKLGILDASGFSKLSAQLDYSSSSAFDIGFKMSYGQSIPSLSAQRLVLNNEEFQRSDWTNTVGGALGADLVYKKTLTSLSLENQFYKNILNISSEGVYEQIESNISFIKATLKQDVKLGPFFTEHALMFQSVSDTRISVPVLTYRGKVFLKFHMFKKNMLSHIGADISFMPAYDLPEFYAVTGVFYNDITQKGRDVIILNPYFNAKVGPFKFFVKTVNALHRLRPTSTDLTSYYHPLVTGFPQYDFRIRFGIKWMLLD